MKRGKRVWVVEFNATIRDDEKSWFSLRIDRWGKPRLFVPKQPVSLSQAMRTVEMAKANGMKEFPHRVRNIYTGHTILIP